MDAFCVPPRQTLKRAIDRCNEVARQRECDQEVINFLDTRVLELETALKQAQVMAEKAQNDARSMEEKYSNQLRTLEDMLQHEKDRYAKQEQEAKDQKKLLVKAVKTLRAEVAALQGQGQGQGRRSSSSSTSSSSNGSTGAAGKRGKPGNPFA